MPQTKYFNNQPFFTKMEQHQAKYFIVAMNIRTMLNFI